jgi:hypothetical protein
VVLVVLVAVVLATHQQVVAQHLLLVKVMRGVLALVTLLAAVAAVQILLVRLALLLVGTAAVDCRPR